MPLDGHADDGGPPALAAADGVGVRVADPESARYRWVSYSVMRMDDGEVAYNVCGATNAKNPYGAYVGYAGYQWPVDVIG